MADERTTTGCWTCRLRKKKCGEEHRPHGCVRCESHNLTCSGYGERPNWMDKGVREKEELAKVKAIVRQNANIKRAEKNGKSSNIFRIGTDALRPAPPAPTISVSPHQSSSSTPKKSFPIHDPSGNEPIHFYGSHSSIDLDNVGALTPLTERAHLHALSTSGLPEKPEPPQVISGAELRERDAALLMHYFDSVFPLQYRFYNPSETETGRGWLLSLLSRTKPLYHAALSLSALHLQVLDKIRENANDTNGGAQVAELYEHLEVALKELQSFIQLAESNDDVKKKVQILSCIVQFISFELFRGGTSHSWEVHLEAGASLAIELISCMPKTDGNLISTTLDSTGTAINFMCGVILWMDLLSTITTAKRTLLHAHRERILAVIQIDKITGCRNWVIACTGDISALAERRSIAGLSDEDLWDINTNAQDIVRRLQSGLQNTRLECDSLKKHHSVRSSPEFVRFVTCVSTQVYAAASLIFLYVTIYDSDPNSTELRSYVSEAISALKDIPEPQMIRSFIWPLIVVGCMASESEQEFFENKFLQVGKAGLAFGNSSQTLAVLRKCWQLRSTGDQVDWRHTMKVLQVRVLFI